MKKLVATDRRFGEVVLNFSEDVAVEGFDGADESEMLVRSFVDKVKKWILVRLEVEVVVLSKSSRCVGGVCGVVVICVGSFIATTWESVGGVGKWMWPWCWKLVIGDVLVPGGVDLNGDL